MLAQEFGPAAGKKVQDLNPGDLWADTPFFAPGMTEDTDNKSAWAIGVTLAGVFKGLRTKKNPPAKGCKEYGIFETVDGRKFRADAPGQLRHILENATLDRYIELTYKGKEYVDSKDQECHQFEAKGEVLN